MVYTKDPLHTVLSLNFSYGKSEIPTRWIQGEVVLLIIITGLRSVVLRRDVRNKRRRQTRLWGTQQMMCSPTHTKGNKRNWSMELRSSAWEQAAFFLSSAGGVDSFLVELRMVFSGSFLMNSLTCSHVWAGTNAVWKWVWKNCHHDTIADALWSSGV